MKNKITTAIVLAGLSSFGTIVIASEHRNELSAKVIESRLLQAQQVLNEGTGWIVTQPWIAQYVLPAGTDQAQVDALKNKLLNKELPSSCIILDGNSSVQPRTYWISDVTMQHVSLEGKVKSGDYVTTSSPLQPLEPGTKVFLTRQIQDPHSTGLKVDVEIMTIK